MVQSGLDRGDIIGEPVVGYTRVGTSNSIRLRGLVDSSRHAPAPTNRSLGSVHNSTGSWGSASRLRTLKSRPVLGVVTGRRIHTVSVIAHVPLGGGLASLTHAGLAAVLKVKLVLHSSQLVKVVEQFHVFLDHALALGFVVLT